jgi:hypothetical protein
MYFCLYFSAMKISPGTTLLLALNLLVSTEVSCAAQHTPQSARKQARTGGVEKPAEAKAQPPADPPPGGQLPGKGDSPPSGGGEQPNEKGAWPDWHTIVTQGLPGATIALGALAISLLSYFKTRSLSREIAERTVSFEAQKLLLEINKMFVADPSLFAIYDDNPQNHAALEKYPKLRAKVDALGYMKLNVFEIVFAKLPEKSREGAWKQYFLDSLDRCSVLSQELEHSKSVYHSKLIEAYEKEWLNKGGKARPGASRIVSNAACLDNTSTGEGNTTTARPAARAVAETQEAAKQEGGPETRKPEIPAETKKP